MATAMNCAACEEIRETDPNLIVNGFTDTECSSLANDTGLNPSSGNNDCTDLNNLNDCLVGNLETEVDSYDVCDWKPFMKMTIPNIWTTLKAIICSICGIWENIHNLWAAVGGDDDGDTSKIDCILDYMSRGASFELDEEPQGDSYIVAGKGCSFLTVSGAGPTEHASDIKLEYVGGGLGYLDGSVRFHTRDFTDAKQCVNFDNGATERTSTARKGNSVWSPVAATSGKKTATGGELIYEIRIKKSEYPQIAKIYQGRGSETSGGAFHAQTYVFDEGEWAWGQHGWCQSDGSRYTGYDGNYTAGHQVPAGWMYVQCRMSYINYFYSTSDSNGQQFTPVVYMGMRIDMDKIDC